MTAPRQKIGGVIRAGTLNTLVDKHNKDARNVGPTRQVNRAGISGGGSGVNFYRLTITDLPAEDYFIAAVIDQATGEAVASHKVAKPLGVRRSRAAHGEVTFVYVGSNTRTATLYEEEEIQTLVEPYNVGDEVMAVDNVTGGTGVSTAGGVLVTFQEVPSTPRWWSLEE